MPVRSMDKFDIFDFDVERGSARLLGDGSPTWHSCAEIAASIRSTSAVVNRSRSSTHTSEAGGVVPSPQRSGPGRPSRRPTSVIDLRS